MFVGSLEPAARRLDELTFMVVFSCPACQRRFEDIATIHQIRGLKQERNEDLEVASVRDRASAVFAGSNLVFEALEWRRGGLGKDLVSGDDVAMGSSTLQEQVCLADRKSKRREKPMGASYLKRVQA